MFYGGAITLGKPYVTVGDELYIQVMAHGVYDVKDKQLIIGTAYADKKYPTEFYGGMKVKGALIDFNGDTPTIYRLSGSESDEVKVGLNPRYIEYIG